MPETTKTCQVKMNDGKPCGRDLYDDECCIFHSKKEDKNVQLFQKALDGIVKVTAEEVKIYDFTSFIFPKGVVFPKQFAKPVTFGDSTFQAEADFVGAVFKGKASFRSATFKGPGCLGAVTFEDIVDFRDTTFETVSFFDGAAFKGAAFFMGAVFKGTTGFNTAVFESMAEFDEARFARTADFRNAFFKGQTRFWGPAFNGRVYFQEATFQESLLINGDRYSKIAFCEEVDFGSVTFLAPQKIQFQKVDVRHFRFLETDLRGVHFSDVEWNKKKPTDRNRVFDEISPDSETDMFDYALIAQLYRRLRANYEENLRYSEAGDFYIGEMEMTRKAERNFFKKLPLLFYKAISNYGESYYRPLRRILAILLIFPLLFMLAGIQPVSLDPNNPIQDVINYRLDFSSTESFLPTTEKIGDYYTCFLYSMSVFSFIRDKKYTTIDNWGHTLFVLESILSPVTLAFFLLALRRRFKR